ncbi:MAG: rod-binding protein [Fimbriimonadia bacterium]|jgi:flagellar protein FlgJ
MLTGAIPATQTIKDTTAKGNELRKATQGVEALFVQQLLSAMRRTASFGDSSNGATAMYRDLMDQAVAQEIARTGRFGIGDILYRQLAERVLDGEQATEGER